MENEKTGPGRAKRAGSFEKAEVVNCDLRNNEEEPVCEEDNLLLRRTEKQECKDTE